jgi:hypothetical protein
MLEIKKAGNEYCCVSPEKCMPPGFSENEKRNQWESGYSKSRMFCKKDNCWYWVKFKVVPEDKKSTCKEPTSEKPTCSKDDFFDALGSLKDQIKQIPGTDYYVCYKKDCILYIQKAEKNCCPGVTDPDQCRPPFLIEYNNIPPVREQLENDYIWNRMFCKKDNCWYWVKFKVFPARSQCKPYEKYDESQKKCVCDDTRCNEVCEKSNRGGGNCRTDPNSVREMSPYEEGSDCYCKKPTCSKDDFFDALGSLKDQIKQIPGTDYYVCYTRNGMLEIKKAGNEYCCVSPEKCMPPGFSENEKRNQWESGYSKSRMFCKKDNCWYWVKFKVVPEDKKSTCKEPTSEKPTCSKDDFFDALGSLKDQIKQIPGTDYYVCYTRNGMLEIKKAGNEYCCVSPEKCMPPGFSENEKRNQWESGYSKSRMFCKKDNCWYWVKFKVVPEDKKSTCKEPTSEKPTCSKDDFFDALGSLKDQIKQIPGTDYYVCYKKDCILYIQKAEKNCCPGVTDPRECKEPAPNEYNLPPLEEQWKNDYLWEKMFCKNDGCWYWVKFKVFPSSQLEKYKISPPFSFSCEELTVGKEATCRTIGECTLGLWIVLNKEGKPLQAPVVKSFSGSSILPFDKNTFVSEGKVKIIGICFSPVVKVISQVLEVKAG